MSASIRTRLRARISRCRFGSSASPTTPRSKWRTWSPPAASPGMRSVLQALCGVATHPAGTRRAVSTRRLRRRRTCSSRCSGWRRSATFASIKFSRGFRGRGSLPKTPMVGDMSRPDGPKFFIEIKGAVFLRFVGGSEGNRSGATRRKAGSLQSAGVAQHETDCAEQCIVLRVLANDYPRAQGGREIAGLDERVAFI